MQRTVTSRMELDLRGESDLVFSMAVAAESALSSEHMSFVIDGTAFEAQELVDRHGSRLHQFAAGPGSMLVEYSRRSTVARTPPRPTTSIRSST